MAKLIAAPMADLKVQLELNYHEVAALEALAGYGFENFVKVFYEHLGKCYLKPHEQGLKTLFETVRQDLPSIINKFQNAKEVFIGTKMIRT